jgi:hypothetical protein
MERWQQDSKDAGRKTKATHCPAFVFRPSSFVKKRTKDQRRKQLTARPSSFVLRPSSKTPMPPTDLIVYACPTGPLATQIEAFYAASLAQCGPNNAHAYPPHITLTGFFHDEPAAVPRYVAALHAAHGRALARGPAEISITDLLLRPDFLAFTFESPWLEALAADFAASVAEPLTRQDAIRVKSWLHLSLAYGFAEQQFQPLKVLAEQHIDRAAPVGWELRFYERQPGDTWICHAIWPI